jgi:hypothetical protein
MLKGEEGIGSSMAMMSQGYKHFEVKSASNKYPSKQEKAKLKCSHCGGTRHLKEGCFKIIGYPDWYHEKRAKQLGDKPKGKANWAATNSNSGYSGPTYYTGSSTKQVSQQGAIESCQEWGVPTRNWTEPSSTLTLSHPGGMNQENASNSGTGQAHLIRAENLGTAGFASQAEKAGK